MIDFSEIATEQIIARGQYSMVRAKREEWLNSMRNMCESHNTAAHAVLRDLQAYNGTDRAEAHLAYMHDNLARMAEAVTEIEELTKQLALIRPLAFPND